MRVRSPRTYICSTSTAGLSAVVAAVLCDASAFGVGLARATDLWVFARRCARLSWAARCRALIFVCMTTTPWKLEGPGACSCFRRCCNRAAASPNADAAVIAARAAFHLCPVACGSGRGGGWWPLSAHLRSLASRTARRRARSACRKRSTGERGKHGAICVVRVP